MYDAGVDPNDPNGGAGGFGGYGGFGLGDIFSQFFGGAFGDAAANEPIPRAQPGRDTLESLTVDLQMVVFGGTQNLTFCQFFGGAFGDAAANEPIPRAQPGRDTLESLTVDLQMVVFGGTQNLTFSTLGTCANCEGTGSRAATHSNP